MCYAVWLFPSVQHALLRSSPSLHLTKLFGNNTLNSEHMLQEALCLAS